MLKRIVRSSFGKFGYQIQRRGPDEVDLEHAYIAAGRRPWSLGYDQAKQKFIQKSLGEPELLKRFASGDQLPPGYGVGFDERCIEYPWLMTNLPSLPGRLLDAGSTLNYQYLLDQPLIRMKKLHILTLFPEQWSFWERGISYFFEDLRDIPIQDNYYDVAVCLSVLEHIGLDNSVYTRDLDYREDAKDAFTLAMRELYRVLKPGGELILSVPFGEYRDFGFQQQFDARLLSRAIECFPRDSVVCQAFYRYTPDGWQVSTSDECADSQYVEWIADAWRHNSWPDPIPVEPDLAAAARAVACVKLTKTGIA